MSRPPAPRLSGNCAVDRCTRVCLNAITAFHAFTRYALLDELLDPDDVLLALTSRPSPASS